MRLLELREAKTNQTMGGYVDTLLKQKIKRLGTGSFSNVFAHPSHADVAVKVFVADDWNYRDWMRFAKRNPTNPYVPKFFGEPKFFSPTDYDLNKRNEQDFDFAGADYGIAFMERLRPITKREWFKFWNSKGVKITDLNVHHFTLREVINLQSKTDPDLVKILKVILKAPDVRLPNLMMRGNQVVFTDPMYDVEDPF